MLSSNSDQGPFRYEAYLGLPSRKHFISLYPCEMRAPSLLVSDGACRDIYILACEIVTILL